MVNYCCAQNEDPRWRCHRVTATIDQYKLLHCLSIFHRFHWRAIWWNNTKRWLVRISSLRLLIVILSHWLFSIWTAEQVVFFLENGYVVIKQAFTKEKAAEWTKTMWIRLGLDPTDKTTWDRERIHMPWHKKEEVATFAPKVSNLWKH